MDCPKNIFKYSYTLMQTKNLTDPRRSDKIKKAHG